ncbi:Pentatricopeptide repeat-containing protein [Ananas comosus]|uniref:Pentatricopeptide repeat-containing protein n=1 Tax=Ananas comosus TaxID=4615 RepID=A0A199UIG5_ANACO|nr:Pentatricopeptide repeat-containing protein [Ananas comosus]
MKKHKSPRTLSSSLTKMITEHAKMGDVDGALKVFDRIPRRNQVSWNAILSALVANGRIDSARKVFDEMPRRNATSYTSIIAGLSRSNAVPEARRIFESVPRLAHSVFTWTAMLSCYAHNDEPLRALKLFSSLYSEFYELGIRPNSHTFTILLKSTVLIRSLAASNQIHGLIVKLLDERGKNCIFVWNSLIDVHAKLGSLVDAKKVFDIMPHKDLGSWNTMMDGYTHNLLIDEALNLFQLMKDKDILSWNILISGLLEARHREAALRLFLSLLKHEEHVKPNASTYTIVLSACASLTMLRFGTQLHARISKNGLYASNTFVCNSFISMYANCGLTDESEQVFHEMPKRDVISWNSVIQGLGQNGCSRKALEIAETALGSNVCNENTFIAILTSCSHAGLVVEGLNYFNLMSQKYGIEPKLDHYICAIDMLGRAGRLQQAYDLLRRMPFAADSVAWSTLLNTCLIHKNITEGRSAARELRKLDSFITGDTLGLGHTCVRTDEIEELRKVFDVVQEERLKKQPGCSWIIET